MSLRDFLHFYVCKFDKPDKIPPPVCADKWSKHLLKGMCFMVLRDLLKAGVSCDLEFQRQWGKEDYETFYHGTAE